jgi:hypothetical protein
MAIKSGNRKIIQFYTRFAYNFKSPGGTLQQIAPDNATMSPASQSKSVNRGDW